MNKALLIARRELGAYLSSFLGFIVLAALLLIEGIYFNVVDLGTNPRLSSDVLRGFFNTVSGGTMILALLLSLRPFAGEREQGTLVLLNTAPITDAEMVGGKFTAGLAMIALHLALTVHMPLLVAVNGKISAGQVLVGYLGVLLLGAAVLAIGLFGSSLVRSQILAFVAGGAVLLVLLVMWGVARVTEPPLNTFFGAMAIHHERQRAFQTGVLRLENVVYYVGVAYFFLLSTTKTLEARRWR
ncbi:MAG: ABC transporter permease [Polyangiaceae bacterium]